MRAALLLPLLAAACGDSVVAVDHLSVVNISPASGSAGVALDTKVLVTFSEGLDGETVTASTIYLVDEAGTSVDSGLVYNPDTATVSISAEQPFMEDTEYQVVLTTGLVGAQSGALLQEVRSSFVTEGADIADNELPIADPGDDQTTAVGELVTLDGSGSYDPEGAALTFEWSLVSVPDGSTAGLEAAQAEVAQLTPDVVGTYVVGLVVDDGELQSNQEYVQVFAE